MLAWVGNIIEKVQKGETLYICIVPDFYSNVFGVDIRTRFYKTKPGCEPDLTLTPEENFDKGLVYPADPFNIHDFYDRYVDKSGLRMSLKMYADREPFKLWRQTAGVFHGKIIFESVIYQAKKVNNIIDLELAIEHGKKDALDEFKLLIHKCKK